MSAKLCPQCNTEYPEEQLFCPKDGSTLKSKGGTADLVGSIIQKVYHVKKKLGEGGMGTVYLAEHVKMGRKSALKVMNPGMVHDADAISRFNREAANASKINHPNVAAVYDFGETEDGLIFLAMEFIEGPSLTKVIEEAGSLPPLRAADITRQASEALSVAHDMGIVHRDLKPDNIMLAKGREGVDVVKVVDFGIAKAGADEGQKVTKTGMVVGTPEYMSPEQLSGDKLDGRSDTYSLGLVAFNMLTGKLPFPAATAQESMIARLMEAPKTLAEMKQDVPWSAEVQAVMDKGLARDAAERYATASQFGRDLYRAVEHMAHHDVTSAHTAMIGRVSGGAVAAAAGAAATAGGKTAHIEKAPTPVPATRVGAATPLAGAPHVPPARPRSKTPMIAGIAAVAVLGFGGWYATTQMGAKAADDTTQFSNSSGAPAGAPAINWTATLARLDTLTDYLGGATATSATLAIAKLDSLAPLATGDTNPATIVFYRARAHLILSDNAQGAAEKSRELRAACSLLLDNEGLGTRGGLGKQFTFFLKGDSAQKLPALCP